jgi:hypothetical protein
MPYIGKQLVRGQNRELDDISSSFNGATTTFNLTVAGDSVTPGSALQLFISIGGVLQNPNTDFTVAGNQITFSTAPGSGLSFFGYLQGDAVDFNTPADGSVTTAKLGSNLTINVADGSAATPSIQFNGSGTDTGFYSPAADEVAITTGGTGRLVIDSSGRLLVGTSTARTNFSLAATGIHDGLVQYETTSEPLGLSLCRNGSGSPVYLSLSATGGSSIGSTTPVEDDDGLGSIAFSGMNGLGAFSTAALISAEVDAAITASTSEMPGRLVFSTTPNGLSSPTEAMRITNGSDILIGTTGLPNGTTATSLCVFYNPNGAVGSIAVSGSATVYNTSSDYRLKENVVALTGAADRLNQLQVCRFNFIADPNTVVDGFIAHEAQEVVPECVTGTKDEVDEDGNPVYQGIDQSKLVPLLTAALQEAIGRIETLEAEVVALKAQ